MVPLQAVPSLQQGPAALHAPENPAPQTGVRGGVPHWPGEMQLAPPGQQTVPQTVPFVHESGAGCTATQVPALQAVPLGQQAPPHTGVPSAQTSGAGVWSQLAPSGLQCWLGQQAVPAPWHRKVPGAQQPALAKQVSVACGQHRAAPLIEQETPLGHGSSVAASRQAPGELLLQAEVPAGQPGGRGLCISAAQIAFGLPRQGNDAESTPAMVTPAMLGQQAWPPVVSTSVVPAPQIPEGWLMPFGAVQRPAEQVRPVAQQVPSPHETGALAGQPGLVPLFAQPAAVQVVPLGQQVSLEHATGVAAGHAAEPEDEAVQRPEGSQPLPAGQQRSGAPSSKSQRPMVSPVSGR